MTAPPPAAGPVTVLQSYTDDDVKRRMYERRMEALRVERTRQHEAEQAEKARAKAEHAKIEAEQALEIERAPRLRAEASAADEAQARRQAEQENAALRALLAKLGGGQQP